MRAIAGSVLLWAVMTTPFTAQGQELATTPTVAGRDSIPPLPADPPATQARAWFGGGLNLLQWPQVSGDWAGRRTSLARSGIEFTLTFTHDGSANLVGGVQRGAASRGLLMGQVSAVLERLSRLRGTRALLSYAVLRGSNGSDFTGDIQAFSNIDAEPFAHLFEAWLEQPIGGAGRLKVGRVDANTEFAVVGPAADFINASAGFSPSILGLPTYPDPKMSANLFIQAAPWLAFSGGLYEGTFDAGADGATSVRDRFSIVQVDGTWKRMGRLAGGRLAVGRWHHSGLAGRLDGGFSMGADGWWATLEQRIAGADGTDAGPARGVQFFAKYGAAPAMLSVFRQHAMAGFLVDGGFRAGSEDALGLAASYVDLSNVAEAGTPLDETSLEVFYKVRPAGFMIVRPNVQYVINPSGNPGLRNALVATLRTVIAF